MKLTTLKKAKEFRNIYQKGKSVADKYMVIYIKKNDMNNYPRFGFSISKKVGKAVHRNRVRRLLKEITRKYQPVLLKDVDIVFIARSPIVNATLRDLEDSFLRLSGKLKILHRGK